MIRSQENQFFPGSNIPTNLIDVKLPDMVEEYLLTSGWTKGMGILLIGTAGCGKTTTGISILKKIHRVASTEMIYWTEYDFLADLRNLWRMEEMTQKFARDDSLWKEYTEWEGTFWGMKESPFLFLDDIGRGYTPMQNYEVENLLRFRETRGLPNITACQSGLWDNMPSGFKSVLERTSMTVRLDARNS